ncbi:MAG: C4-dicarboxylate ABC transporter substrate-binding protein [Alphaproteobacteria bacterium]|nr:MAG: C4-dicarboxylate ABC transporter substrate-binding protein [Alphaproteobacteria bacterium]
MKILAPALALTLSVLTLVAGALAPDVATAQTIVLKKADFGIAAQTRTRLSIWWGEELERRSGGRVKIEYYPANSLVSAADIFESTRSGAVDVGIWVQAYNPAVSPLSEMFNLPGISPRFRSAVRAANELVLGDDFTFFRDELRKLGVEPLYVWGVPDQEFIATKPIDGLAALKGMKVRVIGREWPKLIAAFEGTPVAMPWPEVYEALARGTLDANVGFVTANRDSKLYEVAKHHSRIALGAPAGPLAIMNRATWDGLPADIQAIIRDLDREFPDRLADLFEAELEDAITEMETAGVTFHDWPAEDRARLQAAMEANWLAWAEELESRDLPAREALRLYRELQAKHDAR